MRKKIIQKITLFAAQILAKPFLRLYQATLSVKVIHRNYLRELLRRKQNFIICFWHENMFLPLLVNQNLDSHVLVSQHFDGELIARVLQAFGIPSIRGSSTRGGKEAYQIMKNRMLKEHFIMTFTPDGPTGPRRKMKLGAILLASETGAPILPIGVAATRYRRLNSWDRLLIILPGSHCVHKYGQPVYIPPVKKMDELKEYARKVEAILNRLDKEAEAWLKK